MVVNSLNFNTGRFVFGLQPSSEQQEVVTIAERIMADNKDHIAEIEAQLPFPKITEALSEKQNASSLAKGRTVYIRLENIMHPDENHSELFNQNAGWLLDDKQVAIQLITKWAQSQGLTVIANAFDIESVRFDCITFEFSRTPTV